MNVNNMNVNKRTLGREMIAGVVFVLALIGYGLFRFPTLLQEGGAGSVVMPVVLLLFYGLAGWLVQRQTQESVQTALRQGALVGLVVGGVMVVNLTLENFADLNRLWNAITGLGLFPVLFFSFGWAGFRGAAFTGRLRLGLAAALWGAMVGIVLTLAYGFLTNYLFLPQMASLLRDSGEYQRSGMHDLQAFTVLNCLDAAESHLITALILAALFGTIGGLFGTRSAHRRSVTGSDRS